MYPLFRPAPLKLLCQGGAASAWRASEARRVLGLIPACSYLNFNFPFADFSPSPRFTTFYAGKIMPGGKNPRGILSQQREILSQLCFVGQLLEPLCKPSGLSFGCPRRHGECFSAV